MMSISDASFPSVHTLREVPLFAGLHKEQLESILENARCYQIPARDRLFLQGEPATKFHVLLEGQVRITQVTPDGQQVLIRLVGPGQIFGGIAAIRDGEYPASAEAQVPCVVLLWTSETMQDLLNAFPHIARNLLSLMSDHIQVLQDRLREMATERVERRIAHTLLRLVRHAGRRVEEGVQIDLPLTRQDIAEMAGTTLYTVSRILTHWEADGIVKSERQRVLIRIPHRLVAIAEDLSAIPENDEPAN